MNILKKIEDFLKLIFHSSNNNIKNTSIKMNQNKNSGTITNNIEKRRKAKLTEQNANKDKMKVSKEFIQNKIQNETKTFNAFYGAM